MSEQNGGLLGHLILQTGVVSQEQLQELLDLQASMRREGKKVPRLGELMASKGILTVTQVKNLLREQRRRVQEAETGATSGQSMRFQRGQKAFQQYEIRSRLGENSRCVTYKATDKEKKQTVILQVPRARAALDSTYIDEFKKHARRAIRLDHPSIVRVLDCGEADGDLFIVSEFCAGASMHRFLQAHTRLQPEMAVRIGLAVSSALEHAHARGMFHQEISPSSIIVSQTGDIKLSGFGRVSAPIHNLKTLIEQTGDTPFYVAPEQAMGQDEIDVRTDLYSLGAALYHLLCGTPPYAGSDIESVLIQIAEDDHTPLKLLAPELPEALCTIVETLLQADPDKRYQSAAEVQEALIAFQESGALVLPDASQMADAAQQAGVRRETGGSTPVLGAGRKSSGTRAAAQGRKKRATGKVPRKGSKTGGGQKAVRKGGGQGKWILAAGGLLLVVAGYFIFGPTSKPSMPPRRVTTKRKAKPSESQPKKAAKAEKKVTKATTAKANTKQAASVEKSPAKAETTNGSAPVPERINLSLPWDQIRILPRGDTASSLPDMGLRKVDLYDPYHYSRDGR